MTLSSSSTLAEALAARFDNHDFETSNSIAKAREFLAACMLLRDMRPLAGATDSTSVSWESLERDERRALEWLRRNDPSADRGGITYLDMRTARQ